MYGNYVSVDNAMGEKTMKLYTERDMREQAQKIFGEIEKFIKKFDIEYKLMLDSEKWKEFKKHRLEKL